METKNCLACSALLRGRADKKFCNDYCRNNYNNRLKQKSGQHRLVKNINTALLNNRKVLATLLPAQQELTKAAREKMLHLGFHFRYFTHHYITKTGKTYYYCYDYGYLPLENDWFLIVKKKDE